MKRRETNKKGIEEKGRIKKKWERRRERGTSQELQFNSTGGGKDLHNNGEGVLPIQHCQKQAYNESQKLRILYHSEGRIEPEDLSRNIEY